MIQVYEIDENGLLIDIHVIHEEQLESMSGNIVTDRPPNGLFKHKWDGVKWIEGETQDEKNEREMIVLMQSLQPNSQELHDADLEIKVITILMEMEVI